MKFSYGKSNKANVLKSIDLESKSIGGLHFDYLSCEDSRHRYGRSLRPGIWRMEVSPSAEDHSLRSRGR